MTSLTTEQFKQHFKIEKDTMVLSPQVAMIAGFCGFDKFDYQHPNEIITPTKQYDYVLIDVLDTDKFPGMSGGMLHSFRYFTYALKFLNSTGTLIGKFPTVILNKLHGSQASKGFPHSSYLNDEGHTDSIHIHEDYCFIKIIKGTDKKKTSVFYDNENQFDIDFSVEKYPILHHYNQEFYDYFRDVDISTSCERTTIDGKGDKVAEQLAIRSKRSDFEKVLFVPSNGNRAKAFTFEEVKDKNSGGDSFFAESAQQRDQFIQILQKPKVINLIKEMCYNNYTSMKLDHKKYIFNERIFDFANS